MSQSSLNILYEDPSLIVCAKPHGIATQSRNIGVRDMESMLKTYIYQHCSPKNKNYSQRALSGRYPPTGPACFRNTCFLKNTTVCKSPESPAAKEAVPKILPRSH